jgi:phosphatidylglycerol:prolipoprotein diacylglycerol transferase
MIAGYGALVAGGIAAGAMVAWLLAPRLNVTRDGIMEVIFWAVLGGIIGARLLYVVVQWDYFVNLCLHPGAVLPVGLPCGEGQACYPGQACDGTWCQNVGDCVAAVTVWPGGWVILGGVLGGILGGAVAAKFTRISVPKALALMSVGLPLGHLFGRIGCHLQGCCFGKESSHFMAHEGRLPIQLMEAAGEGVIFAMVLLFFLKRTALRPDSRKLTGFEILGTPMFFLTLYSVLRFVAEWLRGDELRGFVMRIPWPGLARLFQFGSREPVFFSTSQFISVALFTIAAIYWGVAFARRRGNRVR